MKAIVYGWCFLLFSSLWLSGQTAATPAATPPQRVLATVETQWPGVHFEVTEILRFEPEAILVAIRMRADRTARHPTLISGQDRSTDDNPGDYESFSLNPATLVDQATGQTYQAGGRLPRNPFWGEPEIVTNIHRNTWFQLAVRFAVPAPQVGPDGKPLEQRVTLHLPRAKKPMKDLLLPATGQKTN